MTTQQAVDEVDIRGRIDTLIESVRTMDLDGLRSMFAPNLVSVDIEPPPRHRGAEAKWNNWIKVFSVFMAPLDYEVRDLTTQLSGDLAVAYSINHLSGRMRSGDRVDYWLRWTACFETIDGTWLIAHDQVSVPTYFETGRAALNLLP